ncbi:MAG TPA: cytochrome c oxidase assembly protein [Acidimicrobiales bacterium]|nr:cytochrome c oxidase assembly protein [Acidimicrobiales bacterium]
MWFAAAASSPVRLGQLLTGWQHDAGSLTALAVLAALGAAYAAGVHRLARRKRRWSPWRSAAFGAGLVLVELAVGSGIASYDDSVFTVHVVQHLLLMNAAPPLLALGAPITLLLQATRRRTTSRLLRVLHSRPVELLTHPLVAFGVATATMYAYFLTPLYGASLRHPVLHDATHLVFLLAGCLYWWLVVGLDPIPHRLGHAARMGYLGLGIPLASFLGVAILNMAHPIAPEHTLADTRAGGGVLWGFSELFTVAALAVIFLQWVREEDRRAAREDRRLDAVAAAEAVVAAAAERLGEHPEEL